MKFQNSLLKIGIRELNSARMEQLVANSETDMVRWAFENGRYDVRLIAVHYFANSKAPQALPILLAAMCDDTRVVSNAAMNAISKRDVSVEIQEKLEAQRQFWSDLEAYRQKRRNREHKKTSIFTESKERGSKVSFENLRKSLMKPITSGKWF